MLIVKIKDTPPWFFIDFGRLNEKTDDVDSPLPLIYKMIKDLIGAKGFSTLELNRGHWQMPLDNAAKVHGIVGVR